MLEARIQASILKWLRTQEGYWVKISDRFVKGYPDIWGCFRGHMVVIEVKVLGERLEPMQAHVIESIRREGGTAICVMSLAQVKVYFTIWQKTLGSKQGQNKNRRVSNVK